MHAGERRQAHVTGRLGLLDRELQRGGAGLVVAGLALRPAEAGELVGLGLQEAEPPRGLGGTAGVEDGIVEAVLDPGQLAEHRVAADVRATGRRPSAASAAPDRERAAARTRSPAEIAARAAKSQLAAWSQGRSSPLVERAAAIGQLHARGRTRRDVRRRRRGSSCSAPAGRRRRSRRPARSAAAMCSRASSSWSVDASIHAASRSAPARSRLGAASPAASSAARIRCAPRLSPRTIQAQPNPLTMPSASSGSCAALQARAASMLARSARAKARCSAWRPLRTPCVERAGRRGEPRGVRGEGGLGQPGLGHRLERERADAVEQPVADGPRRRR